MRRERCNHILQVSPIKGKHYMHQTELTRNPKYPPKKWNPKVSGLYDCTRPRNHPGRCNVEEGLGGGILPNYADIESVTDEDDANEVKKE